MKKLSVLILMVLGLVGCTAPEEKTSPTPTPEIGLETEVLYYEPYPLAFYNSFYEQQVPDITFEIYNPMDEPITVRVSSEYQGISYKAITTETIMPGERKEINQTIQLDVGEIEKIKTKTKITLHYKIEYEKDGEWKVWDENTVMIEAYPMDTMVWAMRDEKGNLQPLYEYIAVFVTPKADEIQELLAIAKEYHPDRTLEGYQCVDCTDEEWVIYTALQIKAIYDALQDYYGVSYVNVPIAFGKDKVQRINLPKESLYLASTNCIDGAVLFASAIEALDMYPFIVMIPGHAFVAWCTNEECTYVNALETTMVGSASFEEAWEYGNQELQQYWDALQDDDPWNGIIIDVKAMHDKGILPME